MVKVCHITTVHPYFDDRIFLKECRTLAKAGYETYLIASHDREEVIDGVRLVPLPKPKARLDRILKNASLAYMKAKELDADLYHFHDPELIPVGLKLKKLGKRVIYDVHEDVPRQMMSKSYIPKPLRRILSRFFELYENFAAKKFDGIVCATPTIRDRFLRLGFRRVVDVQNMPILSEFTDIEHIPSEKEKIVCYAGGITRERGIYELLEVMRLLPDVKLYLAGPIEDRKILEAIEGMGNVRYLGFVSRLGVKEMYKKAACGVVLCHPEPNYVNSQPIKLFEYMSAALPAVASDFPLWRQIVEGHNCGICVNPFDVEKIAEAIRHLTENSDLAVKMGENGRRVVLEKYNWDKEAEKLLHVMRLCLDTNE